MNHSDLFAQWDSLLVWFETNWLDLVIASVIAAATVLILLAIRGVARRALGGDGAVGWRGVAERVVARTRMFFIVMMAAKLVVLQLDLPPRVEATVHFLFVVAAALQAAIWVRAFILASIERRIGASETHGTLGTAIGLIRVLVSVTVFLIATIVILDNVGVNVTGLIAGLGIGGIAIGLAAQGIFKDLFAALSIVFDRPFRRGDSVAIGGPNGFTGTVEDIGLRTTRLRALDGELVAIGNDKLLQDRIHNYALRTRRRSVMAIKVDPATPADLLAKAPAALHEVVDAVDNADFDRAHVVKVDPDFIQIDLVYYIDSGDMVPFLNARQAIILGMLRSLADLGIAVAPPTEDPPAPFDPNKRG